MTKVLWISQNDATDKQKQSLKKGIRKFSFSSEEVSIIYLNSNFRPDRLEAGLAIVETIDWTKANYIAGVFPDYVREGLLYLRSNAARDSHDMRIIKAYSTLYPVPILTPKTTPDPNISDEDDWFEYKHWEWF